MTEALKIRFDAVNDKSKVRIHGVVISTLLHFGAPLAGCITHA
jgi:hypothetical protein